MEFADPDAPPDPRKPARLRRHLRALGYPCELDGPSWLGSRPVLPDYLPGIGRAPGPAKLFYAHRPSAHRPDPRPLHGGARRRLSWPGANRRFRWRPTIYSASKFSSERRDSACTHVYPGPSPQPACSASRRAAKAPERRCTTAGDLQRRVEVARGTIRRRTKMPSRRIADHLPKVDPAAQAQRLKMWQEVLQKLEAIPRARTLGRRAAELRCICAADQGC